MTASGERPSESSDVARTNVLIEALRSDFKVFGDGLIFLQARVAELMDLKDIVFDMRHDLTLLKDVLRIELPEIKGDITTMKGDIAKNTRDITSIKKTLGRIEKRLDVGDDRATALEERVTRLESPAT